MGFFDSFRKRSGNPAPEAVEPVVEPRTAPWIRVPDADPVPETPSEAPSQTPPAFEEAEPFTEAPPAAPEEPPEAFRIEPPAEPEPAPPVSTAPAAEPPKPEPPKARSDQSGLGRFFGKKETKKAPAAAPKRPARTEPGTPAVILNPTERPEPQASTEAELLARKRTRHRLIGAAAILLAAVIAAPFVLDDEASYQSDPTDTTIPPVTVESAPLSIPDQPKKEAAPAPEKAAEAPAPAQKAAAEARAPEKPAAKPAPKASEKPAEKAQAAQPKKAAVPSNGIKPPAGSGFYVQVLATSSELSAEKTVKKLAALGLPAYRVALHQTAATMWRVRVGLYGTRKEAEGVMGTIVLNGIASQPIVGKQ